MVEFFGEHLCIIGPPGNIGILSHSHSGSATHLDSHEYPQSPLHLQPPSNGFFNINIIKTIVSTVSHPYALFTIDNVPRARDL
jgi:hypothetical protein